MTKKSKKSKKLKRHLANHEQHHAAIHQWIMRKKAEDGDFGAGQHHAMPMHQPWHVPDVACVCLPKKVSENTVTGVTIWSHNGWIH